MAEKQSRTSGGKTTKSRKNAKPSVLITGISGRFGRLLARRLHRNNRVSGVDMRTYAGFPKDVVVHNLDLRKKRCDDLFRTEHFDAVYHMGIIHDPRINPQEHRDFNINGTLRILNSCRKYGVKKLVVLSTAAVYGPNPNNPVFLSEDAPLMAGLKYPLIRDLIELDMTVQSFFWKNRQMDTVLLRPVSVVGPDLNNTPSRYLRMKRAPTVMGFDPMVQIIHQDDMLTAMELALKPGISGIFNIAGPSAAPLSVLIREAGGTTIPIPNPLSKIVLKKAHQWGFSDFPAPELDYSRFICTVDDRRAREVLGFTPQYSVKQTLRDLNRSLL